jgi:hypothetical protein
MELKLPELRKTGAGIFKTDPESLRKWVKNLPLVNVDTCVHQMEFGLSEMNGVEIAPAIRSEVLESLTEPVMHITTALQKKLVGRRFPLNQDALNKSNQCIGLHIAMSTGYKLLVAALAREPGAGTRLALPMQRAIRYLTEALIASYQVYGQQREGIWADLHALYTLAMKHGLQDHQEIDTIRKDPALTSVETAYKQLLLLSLASPYRLRPAEIRQVYDLLAGWAPYCAFQSAQERDASGLFTCQLSSDDPPRYRQLTRRELLDASWLILNTSGLTELANAALNEVRAKNRLRSGLPAENTLKRLMLSWGVMPERQGARRRQQVPIQLVLGLAAVHRLFTQPAPKEKPTARPESTPTEQLDYWFDPTFERPTTIATKSPAGGKTARTAGERANPFLPSGQYPLKGAYALGKPGKFRDDQQIPMIESWKMVDVSVGGYCLLWESNDVSSAQVGELVAIRTGTEADRDGWKLGVVRWMKFTPKRGLILGVQLMASAATPVSAALFRDEAAAENTSQGLLLSDNAALKQPASLLLPSLPFRSGSLCTLTRGEQDEKIILVRELENTGSFAQFHFVGAGGI